MTELENSLQNMDMHIADHPEAGKRPIRNRLVAAVAMGTLSLSLTGCENPFDKNDSANIVQIDQMFPEATAKTAELNDDPRFRASSVTILDGPSLVGSASLVKDKNGSYELATIEHVARALYGMESNVDNNNFISTGSVKKAYQPLYDVPGIGLLSITADKPTFEGTETPTEEGVVDRYTIVPLDSDQQEKLAEAEQAGVISVPEKEPLQGTYGDPVTMPLGETGEAVPFVYLYQNEDKTSATLVPLYVLSQKLDYDEGMAALKQRARSFVPEFDNTESPRDPSILSTAALDLGSSLLAKVKAGEVDPLEASKHLPCMGDSGSAFLSSDGNILGTLSSGQPFHEYGKKYEEFDQYIINRDNKKPQMNRFCLSTVTISSPQQ